MAFLSKIQVIIGEAFSALLLVLTKSLTKNLSKDGSTPKGRIPKGRMAKRPNSKTPNTQKAKWFKRPNSQEAEWVNDGNSTK